MKCSANLSEKYTGLSHDELAALKKSLTRQRNKLFIALVLIAVAMIVFAGDLWFIPSAIFPAIWLPLVDKNERTLKQINSLLKNS